MESMIPKRIRRLVLLGSLAFMVLLFHRLPARAGTVFGPALCQRGTGAPTVYTYSFPVVEPSRGYILKVWNGGMEDTVYESVSSSTIALNGVQILGPNNFDQNVAYLEVPVKLQAQNLLNVEVRGKPGGALVIKVFPFVTVETPRPGQAFSTSSVSVTGQLSCAATHVTVNGLPAALAGTTFSAMEIPLLEGSNTLTIAAARSDGFTDQVSVGVTRDTTPPTITLTSPQDGATVQVPTIDILGSVDDPGAAMFLNGAPLAVTGNAFSVPGHGLQVGANVITLEARDALGNGSSLPLQVTFVPPLPVASFAVAPTSIFQGTPATLTWTATHAQSCSVDEGIGAVPCSGSLMVTPSATATYTLTATGLGGSATAQATVVVTHPAPTATLTASPSSVLRGTPAQLIWSTTDAQTCTIDNGVGSVPCGGSLSVAPGASTSYTLRASGLGGSAIATASITVTPAGVEAQISASPESIPLGQGTTLSWQTQAASQVVIEPGIGLVAASGTRMVSPVATTTYRLTAIGAEGVAVATVRVTVAGTAVKLPEGSFGARYQDLVPRDATLSAYDARRFALVTGKVLDASGGPIPEVLVTVNSRPELGTAATDAAGRFTLPVEGGGSLTLRLLKDGLLPAQRLVAVGWNDIVEADAVVMIPEDAAATAIRLDGKPGNVFTHAGTRVADEFGARSTTLVMTGDTRVYAQTDAGEAAVTAFDVRATEYAIPAAMPAALPPTSGYTYCVNLSAGGLARVRFSKPVPLFVDNFLGFNVGEVVPAGYYDEEQARWVPSGNGKVVRLLDADGDGMTDALDATGDGLPDDLNGDGSTRDEVAGLQDQSRYQPGATFWRVAVTHLTAWDFNWPVGFPADAISPNPLAASHTVGGGSGSPGSACGSPASPVLTTNSYADILGGVYHDDLPIPGTGLTLHYASNRVRGHKKVITVPASGHTVPGSLRNILVRVLVAGRTLETTLPAAPDQIARISWDGLDHLGRPAYGTMRARVEIGFVYPGVYYSAYSSFDQSFAQVGARATAVRSRNEVIAWKFSELEIRQDPYVEGIAEGWTLSSHHRTFLPDVGTVYLGDGRVLSQDLRELTLFAGVFDSCGVFCNPGGLAIDGAGNVYVADTGHHRVVKITPAGQGSTVAGRWSAPGFTGDGGAASASLLSSPSAVTVDPQGNLYIFDRGNWRIRRVDTRGIITTVAGNGLSGFSPDNTQATQARLALSEYGGDAIAADALGNLYLAEYYSHRIRKIGPDGLLTTIAGNGQRGYNVNGPALSTPLDGPLAVAVDGKGNVYCSEEKGTYQSATVVKVSPDGMLAKVAGYPWGAFHEGMPAAQAVLTPPTSLTVDKSGNVYFMMGDAGLRRIDPGGFLSSVPSWQSSSVGIDEAGTLYILSSKWQTLNKLSTPGNVQGLGVPGDQLYTDAGVGYLFSSVGLHKGTFDLETKTSLATFGYDDRSLVSVVDRFGNTLQVQRDGTGRVTAIVAPDGQRTNLEVDAEGRLKRVVYPDNAEYRMAYDAGGLMTDKWDPNGNHFVHVFDGDGRISSLSDPEGGLWNLPHSTDAVGTISTAVQDGEGETVLYQEQKTWGGGYASQATNPDGSMSGFGRTADKKTESETLGCGMTRTRGYALDPVWKYKYLSDLKETTPAGLARSTAVSRAYKDTNGDGKADRFTRTVTLNGRAATEVNDTRAGTRVVTSPAGRTSTLAYDPATLLPRQVSVPGLYPTSSSYDHRGRLTSATVGARTLQLSYDASGNLASLVTPDNKTWSYSHDPVGRLLSEQRPDGSTVSFQRDDNGNLTVLTNPSQVGYGFGYTANNQRRLLAQPLSGSLTYQYDRNRRLLQVTLPSGRSISNSYAEGRLVATNTPEGTTSYSYACSAKLTGIARGGEAAAFGYDGSLLKSDTRAGTLNATIAYSYNTDFALASMTYAGMTVNYVYDADGLLTRADGYTIARDAQNGLPLSVSGNGTTQGRSFNGYGEMDGESWSVGGATPYQWSVSRDAAGRIVRREEIVAGEPFGWEYSYDAMGRLVEVTRNGVAVERYAYDPNGNRVNEDNALRGIAGRAYGSSVEDHVLTAGNDSYQFDVDGYLQSKTTGEGTTSYSYSSRGELQSVWLPDGRILGYLHDPMGRRIAKMIDGAIVEKYLWANMTTLLAVYDGSDNLVERFAYADGRVPVSMTSGGASYTLACDQVGSLRVVTDSSGAVVKRIDYDSFGNIIADSNPAFSVPFGFAGGLHDRDTNLVRFGYRDYAPELGRFTAKDPIDFAGGDTNLYAYAMSDPVNFIDPSGLYEWDVHFALTFQLARRAGFSYEQALTIARADQRVDDRLATHPYNPLGGTQLHFSNWNYAIAGLEAAARNHDLEQFGYFLHIFQDTYSHEGYFWFPGHLFSGHAPDKYNPACERDKHMRDATMYMLQELASTFRE